MKIGFIGLGNMATAMIGGILGKRLYTKADIIGSDKLQSTADKAQEKFGIETYADNKAVVKAADVIDAYIKCLTELKGHNREFLGARQATEKKLRELGCPEADLFCERFLPAFETDLDEQSQIDPD